MTSKNEITDDAAQKSKDFDAEALRDMLNRELPVGTAPITIEEVADMMESVAKSPDAISDAVRNSAEQSAPEEDLSVAPEYVNLPARYRDTETRSMADDPVWADHLTQHWGF